MKCVPLLRLRRLFLLGLLLSALAAYNAPALAHTPQQEDAGTATPTLPLETATSTPEPSPYPTESTTIELLVRLNDAFSPDSPPPDLAAYDPHTMPELARLGVLVLTIPQTEQETITTALRALPSVQYVEPNHPVYALETIPNDPGWVNQYNLAAIRAPQGWDLATGAASVTIAIIDSGVDLTHPDLAAKLLAGYDFVNNDPTPQDDYGHGTHAAGIAAAISNNGLGIAGVSWGARIMPVKVLNASGSGTYANVAAGIIWAVDNGAQVINLSLGGSAPSLVLADAVDYAASRGVLMVAAAGNSGAGSVLYPAAYPQVIAVAATDSSNARAAFSNYGAAIDLSAPGVSIYSLDIGGGTIYRSGTSMATPHVAGLAAILMGLPGGNAWTARAWMESTALDLESPGWDVFTGYGLIQMDAAILAAPTPTPSPSPTPTFTLTPNPPAAFTPTSQHSSSGGSIFAPAATQPPAPTYTPSTVAPATRNPDTNPNLLVTPQPPQVTITALPPDPQSEVSAQAQSPAQPPTQPVLLLCGGILLIAGGLLLLLAARRATRQGER